MATLPAVQIVDEAPGMIATVAQVDAWMETAKAGDVFVYVTGTCLPIRAGGAGRMRELAERDLVHLTQKRVAPGHAFFNYRAMRSEKRSALTKPERPMLTLPAVALVDGEAAIVDALLPVLERFAAHGRPCPTDKQLGARAKLTEDQVKGGLEALVAARLIRILGCAAPTYRRIVIMTNGLITGVAV